MKPHHSPSSMFSNLPHRPTTITTTTTAAAAAAAATIPKPNETTATNSDGATIEVIRRPRGRPAGSKNKPKPPLIITRDTESVMSPYILEVPGGNDVVEAVSKFSRRKNIGLCVLTGSGTVANVTFRQPSAAAITFHGRFDILSISATVLPPTMAFQIPSAFTISLAGPQGQIVGGAVVGSLLAAGTVYLVAASFNNPLFHRLPMEEEVSNSPSGGGDDQSPPGSGGGDSGHHHPAPEFGIGMYSHLSSDVIWGSTAARHPPPPPPPPF